MNDLEQQTTTMLQRAQALEIVDQASYEAAVELGRAIKDLRAEADAHHRPVIQAALEAHRRALDAFRRIDEPLRAAEAEIKRRIAAWTAEQERLRLEAERQLREQVERAAAEELERQIEEMEAAGAAPEVIEYAIRQAEAVPAIAPRVAHPPQPKGVTTRKTYRAQVVRLIDLVRWVADHPTHENLLLPNQSALNALARAQGATMAIPGVRAVVEETVAIRR
ncbi:MAG: hypothetical protein KatS3mg004_1874 [Bryobacteraceae bacterium]|nr:MAG: hypothetical protein KatS3mg004_1874 [Bryobacteraceae bacterium]